MVPLHYVSCFIAMSPLFLSAAASAGQILLPKPNGRFQVGMGSTELIDESRFQVFAPTVQPRKLMLSLFYPVSTRKRTTPVNYLPFKTAAFEDALQQSNYGLVTTNGTSEKLALQLAGRPSQIRSAPDFPIVLFSPAQGTTRLLYGVMAQAIASSGYLVVTIDAPYDVDIVEYTDGSEVLANITVATDPTAANIDLAVSARAQDASFVLDQLRNASFVSQLIPGCFHGLDVSKVAMFGHSLGGAATAAAMLNDQRIAGGLAMDGALFGLVVQKGLDRPFMLMARTNHTRTHDDNNADNPENSWFDIWPKLRGWKRDIILANSNHYTFSDIPIVLETLGITFNATTASALQVTDLNGARALKIVTTYVTSFLDMVLKDKSSALLQGPVAAFPEVSFER